MEVEVQQEVATSGCSVVAVSHGSDADQALDLIRPTELFRATHGLVVVVTGVAAEKVSFSLDSQAVSAL
jgi:hypothetical protein